MTLRALVLIAAPLGWLWWRLLNHLRVEWSVNPQYAYGWAVPVLCLYLLWRRWAGTAGGSAGRSLFHAQEYALIGRSKNVDPMSTGPAETGTPNRGIGSWFCLSNIVVIGLALAWLPTRLIEQANPEWRLVGWALAFEVIGLSLVLGVYIGENSGFRRLVFPLCFFLVAVPWPTLVEGPLVQWLSRAHAAMAAELLDLVNVPAMHHGNILEVGTGAVGLDEACSGIRSLQAVLMIGLFLGEYYRLSVLSRVGVCLLGFALSFGCNLARTTLLGWVAATKGTAAVALWHDPAGIVLLVIAFACFWALVRTYQGRNRSNEKARRPECSNLGTEETRPASAAAGVHQLFARLSGCQGKCLTLLLWLLAAEAAVEIWYRAHEEVMLAPVTWSIDLPQHYPSLRQHGFSPHAREVLRFNHGLAGSWDTLGGAHCEAIFLQWDPGRTVALSPGVHTPENCLPAAGWQCLKQGESRPVFVSGLRLIFRSYCFLASKGPVYVFYTLWRDRAQSQDCEPSEATWVGRFEAVLLGRRDCGQRSLEFAISGVATPAEAESVLVNELRRILHVNR